MSRLVGIGLLLALLGLTGAMPASAAPVVRLDQGAVSGYAVNGADAYRGIPYATAERMPWHDMLLKPAAVGPQALGSFRAEHHCDLRSRVRARFGPRLC